MSIRLKAAALAAGAALGLVAAPALAGTTLSYGAWSDPVYLGNTLSDAPFSSGGPLVATGGNGTAAVEVTADPLVPVFKSLTQAQAGGENAYAEAYARMDLADVLRFSGPGATASVSLALHWDTAVGGMSEQGLYEYDPFQASFEQVWSFQVLRVSYRVPNPRYDPGCSGFGEVQCEPPTTLVSAGLYNSVGAELRLVEGAAQWVPMDTGSAVGNGRFSGTQSLSVTVPTEADVFLEFTGYNTARCFNVMACGLVVDASHSDYVGLALPAGYSFSSAEGYQYVGPPSPVPEPPVWALALAGAAAAGLRARRRSAQPSTRME